MSWNLIQQGSSHWELKYRTYFTFFLTYFFLFHTDCDSETRQSNHILFSCIGVYIGCMQPLGVAWNRRKSQPHAARTMKILADLLIICVSLRPALSDKAHKLKADMRDNAWQSIDEQLSGWVSELLFLDIVKLMARWERWGCSKLHRSTSELLDSFFIYIVSINN